MKQISSALCALLALAATPVWAGKRILMESADLVKNTVKRHELLLDADRMRMNDGNTSVMFLTAGGSRMVILDKAKNEYQEIDQAAMDAMAKQLSGVTAQLDAAMKSMTPEQRAMMEQFTKGKLGQSAPPAVATNTAYAAKGAATVNGFRCTSYEGTRAGQKVSEVCAAEPAAINLSASDFQVMEKMAAFAKSMLSAGENSPFAAMIPKSLSSEPGIKGFPVQTTTFTNGQAVSREQFKSATETTFTAADFSTGTAKKVEMRGAAKGK